MQSYAKNTYVDRLIAKAVMELQEHDASSEEYGVILERLSKLNKMRIEEKSARVSPDTVLTVTANLLGIIMILKHEQLNVITSKATSFVQRTR